jgi:hypothetical protein
MMLDNFYRLNPLTGRPSIDRKQEHQFRADAPVKDVPCVFPGCPHRFKRSTQYVHFLTHVEQHHRKVKP